MKYTLRQLLLIGVAVEIAIFILAYMLHPATEDSFRYAARYSGRLSLGVFLFTFYLFASSYPKPVVENHQLRNFVRLFAVLHLIHFCFLATSVYLNAIPLETVKVIGGALAYSMIVAAPFMLHKLGFKLQLVYFYYVSLVMILTYVARMKGDFPGAEPYWFHYLGMSFTILCGIVFAWWMYKKTTASSV